MQIVGPFLRRNQLLLMKLECDGAGQRDKGSRQAGEKERGDAGMGMRVAVGMGRAG